MSEPNRIEFNLTAERDDRRVLANPHKGWYLHYYDDGLHKYGARLAPDDLLEDFPGLTTIFLRLPWETLEPAEGRFNWDLIDRVAEKWVPTGRTISFCITCKETDPHHVYATPKWVSEAGALGSFILRKDGSPGAWEPDYGDPIFLQKLRNFHTAFAARYDHQPWVEWVDIGSYGDWGEGHTACSSLREWPVETLFAHFDIFQSAYRHSRLEVNDDHVGSRTDRFAAERMREEIDRRGFALTDHGVSVDWFAQHYGYSTLRDGAWLRASSARKPVVLELEHYHLTIQHDRWQGGRPLTAAVEETRASFAGFHGYAREWLEENKVLATELANTLGYWFFLHAVSLSAPLRPGTEATLLLRVENRGVAPLYYPAEVHLRLTAVSGGAPKVIQLSDADPRRWAPCELRREEHPFTVPADLREGLYQIELAVVDHSSRRIIELALKNTLRSSDGYYLIGEISVARG